jgi:branched-chain amino acid transport system substrate-binding protein
MTGFRGRYAVALVTVGVLATGCSLLLKLNADQCLTDGDCAAKGDPFVGTTCLSGVCTKPATPEAGDDGSSAEGEAGEAGESCISNQACISAHQGLPYACLQKGQPCAPLLSTDCVKVFGHNEDENPIYVGYIDSFKGANALGLPHVVGVEMAINELNENAGGIPAGVNAPRRRMALIECDVGNGTQGADLTAARHLVNDIGVPAIVGLGYGLQFTDIATQVTIPKNVFLISPFASAPTVQKLASQGLTWSVSPNSATETPAEAALATEVEQLAKADPTFPGGNVKLSLFCENDPDGVSYGDSLQSLLMWNGQNYQANQAVQAFLRINYESPLNPNPNYTPAIQQLVGYGPQMIEVLGQSEMQTIIPKVEGAWTAPEHPYWNMDDLGTVPGWDVLLQGNDSLRKRMHFVAVNPDPRSTTAYNNFLADFSAYTQGSTDTFLVNYAYDAAYMMIYAAAAAPSNLPVLSGQGMALGMTKLLPPAPTKVEVGPTPLPQTLALLSSGGNIDLVGSSGALDLDPTTGTPAASSITYYLGCFLKNGMGKVTASPSGQTFNSANGLQGTMTCP